MNSRNAVLPQSVLQYGVYDNSMLRAVGLLFKLCGGLLGTFDVLFNL